MKFRQLIAGASVVGVAAAGITVGANPATAGEVLPLLATPASLGIPGKWKKVSSSTRCSDIGVSKCKISTSSPKDLKTAQLGLSVFAFGSSLKTAKQAKQWLNWQVRGYRSLDRVKKIASKNTAGAKVYQVTMRVERDSARIVLALRGKRVALVSSDHEWPGQGKLPTWGLMSTNAAWTVNPGAGKLPTSKFVGGQN